MQQGSPSESPPSPNMNVPSPKHHATYTRQQNGSSNNNSSSNNTLGSTYNAFQYPVRNDAKLGGVNNNLIAFVRNRDIWVATTEGYEIQLTTSSLQRDDPTLSSGTSEHVMQVFTNIHVYHVYPLTIIGSGRISKVYWLLLGTIIIIHPSSSSNQSHLVLGDK